MQVWCNGKMVGEAKIAPRPGMPGHEVHVLSDFDYPTVLGVEPLDEEAAVSKIYLPIVKRHLAVDEIEFMQGVGNVVAMIRERYDIPADAEVAQNWQMFQRVFSWNVFNIDPATFEEIFDMDWFTPADTREPDPELYHRRLAGMV